jgi:hypothetical protein
MKTFTLSLLFVSMLLCTTAQTVILDGYVFLENQANHNNVSINLNRLAPTALSVNLISDSTGYFSDSIEKGIYNITYVKNGFISEQVNDVAIYSNTTLSDITLIGEGLSGDISGVLQAGTYHVTGTITIPGDDSLIIEPGTTLKFHENTEFKAWGKLIAQGTINDSIIFTSINPTSNWFGAILGGPNEPFEQIHKLTYVKFENSSKYGIEIYGNATLDHSDICNNSSSDYGGGIYVPYQGNYISITNCKIYNNTTDYAGGGIYITNMAPTGPGIAKRPLVANCLIFNNTSEVGSAISATYEGGANYKPLIINNTIIYNTCTDNRKAAVQWGGDCSAPNIINNIIAYNSGFGVNFNNCSSGYFAFNNTFNNSEGNYKSPPAYIGNNLTTNQNGDDCDPYNNIQLDPEFVDAENFDFRLLSTSPVIDAGLNDSIKTNFDFDFETRLLDGNNYGLPYVDMGAYEFNSDSTSNINTLNYSPTSFSCYPNPSNDFITLEINKAETIQFIELLDVTGKIIKQITGENNNKLTVDLSLLKSGLYLVRLISESGIHSASIVKN